MSEVPTPRPPHAPPDAAGARPAFEPPQEAHDRTPGVIESPVEPSQPAPGPINVDTFCLACGYNLRGLSGDVIRCPECGEAAPVDMLAYPAERIRKYLRMLESHLVAGVALTLLALPVGYVSITDPQPGAVAALGFLAAIWLAVFYNFRKLCGSRTNWRRGIFRYHVVGCLACIVVVALVSGSVIASDLLLGSSRTWRSDRMHVGLATFPVILIALVVIGRRLHRWLLASLTVMRREVAVSLAKEYFAEEGK